MTPVITIARRLPSQNNSHYRHWSHYAKERDLWFILIRAQLPPIQCKPEKVFLLIRSYRNRLVDYANLVGGAKPIPDCLQRLGYVVDDSPRWFDCRYEQIACPRQEERTEIHFLGRGSADSVDVGNEDMT